MLNVNSEINKLEAVILHEPGEEINNLTPDYLGELLFDDIPWLPLAKEEHKKFAQVFLDNGIKVYYLVDLVKETLEINNEIKEKFIKDFIMDAGIYSQTLSEIVFDYLNSFSNLKEMILKCISGIKKMDLNEYRKRTLTDYVSDSPFITYPIPNLYFTRDPFVVISSGVAINSMHSVTRKRETIFGHYIFLYHPKFKDAVKYYSRNNLFSIEGGDILVLNKETLIVGVSERTSPQGIELLTKNIFNNGTDLKRVLAFSIPKKRTFMHLDTIFTQVDYDKFTIHKGCYNDLVVYELTKDLNRPGKLNVKLLDDKLENILKHYMGVKVKLIPCGGDDKINSDREQWSDGSNALCISPGVVIVYERNEITNKVLEENGIKVIKIPSSELSRGRGGPRCMSMPIYRKD